MTTTGTGSTICESCAPGKFRDPLTHRHQQECDRCPAGFAQKDSGQRSCKPCGYGKVSETEGQALCLPCVPGKHMAFEGQRACAGCPVNSYSAGPGEMYCKECPRGRTTEGNSSACSRCFAGKRVMADYTCQACPSGQYQNQQHQIECVLCPAGFFQNFPGQPSCQECIPGTFSEETGTTVCALCAPGRYRSAKSDTLQCSQCPRGKTTEANGSATCNLCDIGRFGSEPGVCFSCRNVSGGYQDTKGMQSCKQCDSPHTQQPNLQRTGCERVTWRIPSDCKPNIQYLHNPTLVNRYNWTCRPCPRGGACEGQQTLATLVPLDGWWRVTKDLYPADDAPFAKCPFTEDCSEVKFSNNTNDPGCKIGTTGILCSRCRVGYDRTAGVCEPCQEAEIGLRVTGLCGLLALTLAMLWRTRKRLQRCHKQYYKASKDARNVLKTLVSFMQVNLSLPNMLASTFEFPSGYSSFLNTFTPVNVDFASLVGVQCVMDVDARISLLVSASVPLSFVVFAGLYYSVARHRMRAKWLKAEHEASLHGFSAVGVGNRAAGPDADQQAALAADVFDLVDMDGSGHLDSTEMLYLVNEMRWRRRPVTMEEAKKIMVEAGSMLTKPTINKAQFITAWTATSTSATAPVAPVAIRAGRGAARRVGEASSDANEASDDVKLTSVVSPFRAEHWVSRKRLEGIVLSTTLPMLLMFHAPLSASAFEYFDCHKLGRGQAFLRQDYSIRCYSEEWVRFLPVAVVLLTVFGFGLPMSLGAAVLRHRRKLQAPGTRLKMNWLYARNRVGTEWWEIFELTRKILLIGCLVLLPPKWRAPTGVIVSLIACCTLNAYWPYRAK